MSNELTPYQAVKNTLMEHKAEFAALLPKNMTPERLLQIYLTEIKGNPRLMACTPKSLLSCIIETARLGLDPGSVLGLCFFVPYKSEARFQLGFPGLCELIYRTGRVSSITCGVVQEGDDFTFEFGTNQFLKHIPVGPRDDKLITHAYSYCTIDGKYLSIEVMDRGEIDTIMKKAVAKQKRQDGPWYEHFGEMSKKTVLKRHSKRLPKSIDVGKAIAEDNKTEFGQPELPDIDIGEAKVVEEDESWKTEALEEEEREAMQDE